MELKVKTFDQLSTKELYEILKARNEVFIVEQTCIYPDLDRIDYEALHLFFQEEEGISAYLRAFPKKGEEGTIQIGRVLTVNRGTGLGGRLLHESLAVLKEKYPVKRFFLEAQCYATGYYEREGFVITSEEYLEDGVPHVDMVLEL